jgi:multiple sugar transport system substrate-binding protein
VKDLLAHAASLFLAAAVATLGCGEAGDRNASGGRVSIRYFRWADPPEHAATEAAIARFEELNPEIDVKLEYTSWGGYGSKLQTLIAGRDAPDVFALSGAFFHDLRKRGALADLTPLVERDRSVHLQDFYRPPLELFTHDGRLYGLPRDFNVVALFYNRDLFDRAALSYPDTTWTWEDLRRNAIALTRDLDGDGRLDQWGLQVSNDMEICWANYIYQNGGRILDPTRRMCLLGSPESVGAIEFLRGLLYVDKVSPSPIEMESLSDAPFRNGRIAMITSGSWTLQKLDETEGFRYGVAPLPRGGRRAAVANGVANAISARSGHPESAWRFVTFLSGDEGQRLLARSGTSIPALKRVAESDDFLAAGRPDVDRHVFLRSMVYAETLPFTPGIARWAQAALSALERVWLDEVTPAEAMAAAAPEIDAILAAERD